MHRELVSTAFILGIAAVGLTAIGGNAGATSSPPADTTTVLYSHYRACDAAASLRQLSEKEVSQCATIYLQLKLSLLDGVTYDHYVSQATVVRAAINKAGYAAYRIWLDERLSG